MRTCRIVLVQVLIVLVIVQVDAEARGNYCTSVAVAAVGEIGADRATTAPSDHRVGSARSMACAGCGE